MKDKGGKLSFSTLSPWTASFYQIALLGGGFVDLFRLKRLKIMFRYARCIGIKLLWFKKERWRKEKDQPKTKTAQTEKKPKPK